MTTGPLGQGFASAIGFAYGERFQRGLLDPETPKEDSPFYHKIWAICGEGDIEEGISGEAASLAANQKLGNLTVIFDANRIQIEGDTNLVVHRRVQLHPARRLLQGGHRGSGRRHRQGRSRRPGPAEAHQGSLPDRLADPGQDQRPVLPRFQAGRRGRRRPQETPRLRSGGVLPRRRRSPGPRSQGCRARPGGPQGLGREVRRLAQGQPGQGCPVRPSEGRRTAGRLRQGS